MVTSARVSIRSRRQLQETDGEERFKEAARFLREAQRASIPDTELPVPLCCRSTMILAPPVAAAVAGRSNRGGAMATIGNSLPPSVNPDETRKRTDSDSEDGFETI
ncbi:hypothetical protein CISG_04022 [Coccidioides immitis RMSCC 3703]|uniref:Uncharacterized protein n=2 Tax=Coccidioides immitis TaxID=5501 RepID=A0A0J8QS86_COCIT|nr:hypothetical protein CIRG_08620 [Coccidioides immitis RMSCC 2394]KMU74093.1 hypothetical protein CISG_04022 [Coccidioides immitis RMSCC 3703]